MFYNETQAIKRCEEEPSLIFDLINEDHKELVDKILSKKLVSVNTVSKDGDDVLMYMLKQNWYDLVIKYMKKKEWDVNHPNNDGDTFAHILVMKKYLDVMEIMKQLLKNTKLIPNIRNKKGETILDKSINDNYIYTTIKILEDERFNNIDLMSFKNLYEKYIKNDNYGVYSKMNNLEIILSKDLVSWLITSFFIFSKLSVIVETIFSTFGNKSFSTKLSMIISKLFIFEYTP